MPPLTKTVNASSALARAARPLGAWLAAAIVFLWLASGAAHAQTMQTIADLGNYNAGDLTADAAGNLYGVKTIVPDPDVANPQGYIQIYELVSGPSGFTMKILWTSTNQDQITPPDEDDLAVDAAGDIFGIAETYWPSLPYTDYMFELKNSPSGYTYSIIHSFTCAEGAGIEGRPVIDASGNLFGAASEGGPGATCFGDGADYLGGTVFELTPDPSGYTLQVLHSFPDGEGYDVTGLVADASGNLFGTTKNGGADHAGVLFEMQRQGTTFSYESLADLPVQVSLPLVIGPDDTVDYITDPGSDYLTSDGKLYSYDYDIASAKPTELYSWPPGTKPLSGLVADAAGNFYGIWENGVYQLVAAAGYQRGWVLQISTSGWEIAGNQTVHPAPAIDKSGNLYAVDEISSQDHQDYEVTPPAASVLVSPTALDFGPLDRGTTSAPQQVTIYDDGTASIAVNAAGVSLTGSDADRFSIVTDKCSGATLQPNGSCVVTLEYVPAGPASKLPDGTDTATLDFADSAAASPQTVTLSGSAGIPTAAVASSLQFFYVQVGTTQSQTLGFYNSSTVQAPLSLDSITLDSNLYKYSTDCPSPPVSVAACTITVTFSPTAARDSPATLTIKDNTPGGTEVVQLDGSGLSANPNTLGTFAVNYDFDGKAGGNDPNGLVADSAGDLFGTTQKGGSDGAGTAFELVPNGDGTYSEKNLWDFGGASTDGQNPVGRLLMDQQGNLTGATGHGGSAGDGVVFELSPSASGEQERILHSFTACGEGRIPGGGLVADSAGNLYGTTEGSTSTCGGHPGNDGTVYELVDSGANYTEHVLYSFDGAAGDGMAPAGPLVINSAGDIFGTALNGGPSGVGTAYELVPSPLAPFSYVEKALKAFTNLMADPAAGLTADAAGNLYGALQKSLFPPEPDVLGASPGAAVFLFSAGDHTLGFDAHFAESVGALPMAPPEPDSQGNLYGSLELGGSWGNGSTYGLMKGPDLADMGAPYGLFHSFAASGQEGIGPAAPLLLVGNHAFGTTIAGGTAGGGVVFSITIPSPAVALSATALDFTAKPESPQQITVNNTGNMDLQFPSNGVQVVGANSGDFALTADTCTGANVTPGASCSVTVTFDPAKGTASTASMVLTDNANGAPQSVTLTGQPDLPVVALAPAALTFASQPVAVASQAETVVLSNTGNAPLTISSVSTTGDYAQTSSCKGSLAAGANCVVSVVFTPTVAGARVGALSMIDSAADSPQTVTLQGTGTAPGLLLGHASINFGSVPLGSTASMGLAIANTGNAPLTISALTASGDFGATNACPTIPPASDCALTISFTPSAAGARAGSVSISDNLPGSPQTVPVTGTGEAAGALLTPASLAFPNTLTGQSSNPITVTLAADGQGGLSGIVISTLGDFSQTNNCPASLSGGSSAGAVGQSCTISLVFAPTQTGQEAGSLIVKDSIGQQVAALSGAGLAPGIAISQQQLVFGSQPLKTTSPAQTVAITNSGASALTVSSITASDGFSETSTCTGAPAQLATGKSCTVDVTFSPAQAGQQSGSLTITDSAGTQTVALSGLGAAPGLSLSPSNLTFGAQPVGATSAQQTITVTNTGTSPLSLGPLAASGDFTLVNLCPTAPATLAAGASCMAAVSFTPSATGTRTGSISVSDSTGAIGATAALIGTGTLPGITASPATLFFGGTADGATSSSQTVTVTNTGSSPLLISSVQTSGDFTQSNTCTAAPLAPGASCVVSVAMTPTLVGTETGSLLVLDNADGQHAIALSGVGTAPGLQFSPAALAFGSQPIPGANSTGITLTGASQTVVLTNSGSSAATIAGLTTAGPFSQTNDCGSSLAAGASCTVTVSFAPVIQGEATGSLALPAASGTATGSVALTGYGSPTGLTLAPAQIDFGVQSEGAASTTQTTTLTNSTGEDISNLTISASGEFTESDNCNGSLASKASCTITVSLQPQTAGAITGAISISGSLATSGSSSSIIQAEIAREASSSNSGLAQIALTGNGSTDPISLSSATLTFGPQIVGASSTAQTITVTNNGQSSAAGMAIAATGDFAETTTCGASLVAGANCSISVVFTPTSAGTSTGQLTVTSSTPATNQTVTLVGTGADAAPAMTLAPTSLDFGSQTLSTASAAQTVTLTNSGTAALTLTSIAASGDFAQTNTCGSSVAAGANCTISVTFTPKTAAAEKGTLTLTDNATGSPQTVALTGTGAGFSLTPPSTTSATVKAGSTATFTASLNPGNYTGSVALSCTGAPANATCRVSPISASLTAGGAAQSVTVTLATTASSVLPPLPSFPSSDPAWPLPLWALALGLSALLALRLRSRYRRYRWALCLLLAVSLLAASCGGGASTPPPPPTQTVVGTPAGTYTLHLVATGTGLTQTVSLTVTVQ